MNEKHYPQKSLALRFGFALFLEGDTFTYDEVERNVLWYIHDGSSAWEDNMEISVTDGLTVTTAEVKVEVSPSENRGPRLAPSSSLRMTVASQHTAVITRSHLAYVVSSGLDSLLFLALLSGLPTKIHHGWALGQRV